MQSMSKYHNSSVHNQTLDEDSSSSANSGEINEVFGVAKGAHDGAGVTPGLRRRRERAERQKSFMREQQEAAAAGIRPFEMKDFLNINNNNSNHGMLTVQLSPLCSCVCFVAFNRACPLLRSQIITSSFPLLKSILVCSRKLKKI